MLKDWKEDVFSYRGETRRVYRRGAGPGVVVIHEMPGLTPEVECFASDVVEAGYTVAMPHLFGKPGTKASAGSYAWAIGAVCVSREFVTLATSRTSPIVVWLRALARDLHTRAGGPGVGVVGMCVTGGSALAMTVDDWVLAPVLGQPSIPLAISKGRRRGLGLGSADLARAKQRVKEEDLCVLGLRFTCDWLVGRRFDRLREELGERFLAVEIPSGKCSQLGFRRGAHSVLTFPRSQVPDNDAARRRLADAERQVLELFDRRLKGKGSSSSAGLDHPNP